MAVTKPHTAQSHGIRTIPPVDPIWVDRTDTDSILDYPAMAPVATITLMVTRRASDDGSTVASGSIPLVKGQVTAAGITAKTQRLYVNTGGGLAEVAVFCKGYGRYSDNSYRTLYLECVPGGAIPVYPDPTLYASRAKPTAPSAGYAAELRFLTGARVPADIARTFCTTADGFADPTTHLPPGGAASATGWMRDLARMGSANIVIACTDEDYLSKCGVFGVLATRAESAAITSSIPDGYIGTRDCGALSLVQDARFDKWRRDHHFNDEANMPQCLTLARVTNAAYAITSGSPGTDLTVTSSTDPAVTAPLTWNGTAPPQYYNWRYAIGVLTGSGALPGHNYYDAGIIYYREYARTGDLTYLFRGHCYVWANLYWARWAYEITGTVGLVDSYTNPPTSANPYVMGNLQPYLTQPEGWAMHHLLTGDPESRSAIESFASNPLLVQDPAFSANITNDVNYSGGTGRPQARILHHTRWAWLITRASGAAEGSTPGVNGVETMDYHTELVWKIDRVCNGTAYNNLGVNGPPAPGWRGYWSDIFDAYYDQTTVAKVGFNCFMQPMVCDALQKIHDEHPITEAQRAVIRATVKENADFIWTTMWEGDPSDNPYTIESTAMPSFRTSFATDPAPTRIAPSYYRPLSVTLSNMFAPTWAWLARTFRSGSYRAIAERIFTNAVGLTTDVGVIPAAYPLDGYTGGPYLGQTTHKAINEQYTYSPLMFECFRLAPATTAVPSDAITEVKIIGATSGTITVGQTLQFTAKARQYQRHWIALAGHAVSVTSSDASKATATVSTSAGIATVVITAVGAGSPNITLTIDGITAVFAATTQPAQFTDDWSSATISGARWTTSVSGSAAASAATSDLVLSTSAADGVARVTMLTACSLDASGASGAQFRWKQHPAGFSGRVLLVDASGNGWGFSAFGVSSLQWGTVATFAFSGLQGITFTANDYFRFVLSGGRVYFDHSADGMTWTNYNSTASGIGTVVTTAMKLRFEADNTGQANALSEKFGPVVFN